MIIEKGKAIEVIPEYGFGWRTCETNKSIDVPEPFAIRVMEYEEAASITYIVGEVESEGHDFGKLAILLSLRAKDSDMIFWNVYVYKNIQLVLEKIRGKNPNCVCTGFARMDLQDK